MSPPEQPPRPRRAPQHEAVTPLGDRHVGAVASAAAAVATPVRRRISSNPAASAADASSAGAGAGGDGGERKGRAQAAGWKRVLKVGLICFAVWLLLDRAHAHEGLERIDARGSTDHRHGHPAADLVGVAHLGLSSIVNTADHVMGRGGSGVVAVKAGTLKPSTGPHTAATVPVTTIVTHVRNHRVVRVVKPVLLADGWSPFPTFTHTSPSAPSCSATRSASTSGSGRS